jgi:hypothetical protein
MRVINSIDGRRVKESCEKRREGVSKKIDLYQRRREKMTKEDADGGGLSENKTTVEEQKSPYESN